ncbi:bifunctional diaminohydroxyphosphoribosylaminopyrimidine deaminase/5-amino-6-(5-phosphoribosylamino)uracil reductase RibD [Tenacibaculum maritimum]|uniref:bifunctional diaminohydroxyphosphoribosylaminopyrimidine deaminase/5-amino-6-(5-phosphoribosylamino)uracil reductase RibD n=1 Tax=Tenacibaculum maritimum TaxID=107401 RepID=UPI0021D070BA|nr:bifunctional diaminohydroxyphosphoribosylaminopyrimidine deaminase/5-amino-6-(5-phosphoribosylamino)uracil reductase RibD [Tenacibaculum maritimum]
MNHTNYIQRCLQLAKNGIGTTRPNPSVGAVIVHKGKIIGEGFTSPYGGAHAEVNAIRAVKNKELLKEATIYVTLEPCAHFGKTPPCADLIIQHKIPNVVIGTIDTNSLVAGKGIKRLKKSGCNVTVNILKEACIEHHKRFFTVQNQKRPYIILKWAETQDGLIAPSVKKEQTPIWISNVYSQQLVHKWRAEEHAILVGTNTVLADNPQLNVRSWCGKNPIRLVIDKSLQISQEANVLDGSAKTIVFFDRKKASPPLKREGISYKSIDFSTEIITQIVAFLQKEKIQSLIVEGGTQTLQSFIDLNLWDEARVFIGDVEFKNGIRKPRLKGKLKTRKNIVKDVLKIYTND